MAVVEKRAGRKELRCATLQSLVAGTQDSRLQGPRPDSKVLRRHVGDVTRMTCLCAAILGGISNLTQRRLRSMSCRAADLSRSPAIEPGAEAIHVNIDHWGREERQQL